MLKSEKPDNLLQIARYFNEHPRDSVKNLLKFCQAHDTLRSYDAIYRALRLMEENRILLNGNILVKNHKGYNNVHYLVQSENVDRFMTSLKENENSIEIIYRSRQGKENVLYIKTTEITDFRDVTYIERIEWESYTVIFPWKWNSAKPFLRYIPEDIPLQESPPPRENLKAHPDFTLTEDIKQLLYWYKVNVRLPDVPIMKETRLDHRKVKTLRKRIFANSIVYFPVFLHGVHNYVPLYFSFFTEYYTFFMNLFAENSATSFLVRGRNGRISLFVNTIRPTWVLRTMEKFERAGIVQDMLFFYLQDRWSPLVEDFKSGKIPRKYFWMFGTPKKKSR